MRNIAFCLALTALLTASAQNISGSWKGLLELGVLKLNIVVNIATDGTCTLDSPDQGAKGIPAKIITISADALKFKASAIGAEYEGKLEDGVLRGTFTQNGMKLPLDLKPGSLNLNRPQTPRPPFPYRTEEVVFTNVKARATLAGTLSVPTNAKCAVLMVTGSGQQNRDEELFGHRPFAVIADYLARKGIASLRYDDRATGKSKGGEVKSATTRDFAEDAEAGLAYLRTSGLFRKIGILGHSEGGMIAFMLGAKGKVDFIVSLAGPAVKGDELLLEQHKMVLGDMASNLTLEQIRDFPANRKNAWMRFFLDYNPQTDIQKTVCPVLALNGEKDSQVVATQNVPALRRALPTDKRNVIKTYPSLNHLFQHCRTGLPSEYAQIEETFSEEVLADICNWILRTIR